MIESKDSKQIRNISWKTTEKLSPLHSKYEDILLLLKSNINTYSGLSKTLKVKYRTIKDRVDFLVQREFLIRGEGKRNIPFFLTKAGNDYLEIYSSDVADFLILGYIQNMSKRGSFDPSFGNWRDLVRDSEIVDYKLYEKSALISKRGHKITRKTPKTYKFLFDNARFREYCEQVLSNLPKGYPKNPILLNRAHWITFKFPILQQDKDYKRMTLFGENEKGPLPLQTWVPVPMKNWYYYQGTLFHANIPFECIFTTRSVRVRFQTIFTRNPLESSARILKFLYFIKKTIEDYFSTERTKFYLGDVDHDSLAYCILQHYGILIHPLAVICDTLGIIIEDKQGRFRIDASKGVPEIEVIHSWFALDDIDFLFDDIVWQVKNRSGVQEAFREIHALKEETTNLQPHAIKANNQFLVLADQTTLINQRIKTNEGEISTIGKYLAQTTQLLHETTVKDISQNEQLEERISSLEKIHDSYRIIKRTDIEKLILTFPSERTRETGYTRNEIVCELREKLGSISPTITKLVKEGVLIETKKKKQAGRYFINSSHLSKERKKY